MCGIAGFIARPETLIPDSCILDMTNIIRHRGPDDEGFLLIGGDNTPVVAGGLDTPDEVWKTPTPYQPARDIKQCISDSKLAFGHRRLSILDLSPGGHQPMSFDGRRYWIIYNGEIYNYNEIKADLEKSGYCFSTKSDTELILAAYSEWGTACFDRFMGMWAFAVYDHSLNEVILSRDRYGIKPLYYYFSDTGDFYFGSEIKQFTVLKQWQARLNPDRVYDQLIYSFTDHTDETMFNGVFQLPGGTFFKSKITEIIPDPAGKLKWLRWYTPERKIFKGSFMEATENFEALFKRSVLQHLYADVPVGTALSGGLDSSSIVCEVNRILKQSGNHSLQKTFSSCTEYEKFSEKKWMDIVINHTKVDAHFSYPSLDEVFSLTQKIIWHHDEPYQSQSAFLAFNLFGLARSNGVKVLLNGQGADEYMGGYGQFTIARYASMLKRLSIPSMVADMRNMKKFKRVTYSGLIQGITGHLLPVLLKRSIARLQSSSDHVKNIIDNKKLNADTTHPYDVIPVEYDSVSDISRHLTFYSTLPKYLHWEDRNSMANSVEARVPFLDHRLVEFTYNLPDHFLEKDGVSKRVMRESLAGLLPAEIKNRRDKMGFVTPEELWVKKENPAFFGKKLSEAVESSNGIIKPEALQYFDNVINGSIRFDYTYWRLILFGDWIQKFKISV